MRRFLGEFNKGIMSGHRYSVGEDEFIGRLARGLRKRGHRADLGVLGKVINGPRQARVDISFGMDIGKPSEADLEVFSKRVLPGFEIDWRRSGFAPDAPVFVAVMIPEEEIIPVRNAESLPEGFVSVGAGVYRKKGSLPSDHEVWHLVKGEEGELELRRKRSEDVPTYGVSSGMARADGTPREASVHLQVGHEVRTPEGTGILRGFDRVGNPIVAVHGLRKVFSRRQVDAAIQSADAVQKFFTDVYGDPAFAADLVKDYGTRKPGIPFREPYDPGDGRLKGKKGPGGVSEFGRQLR